MHYKYAVLLPALLIGCSHSKPDTAKASVSRPGPDDTIKLANQLPDLVAKYRAAGGPWVTADLGKATVDPTRDAGPLIRSASAAMKAASPADFAILQNLAEQGNSKEAAKLIAPYDHAIALAVQASQKPSLYFGRDPDLGYLTGSNFTYGTTAKALCELLAYQAEIEAKEGDADRAAADLSAGFRLSALLTQEHDLIGGLIRIACNKILLSGAQFCEASMHDNLDGLKTLRTALSRVPPKISFADCMRGEIYMQIAICRNEIGLKPGDLSSIASDSGSPPNIYPSKPMMRTGLPITAGQRAVMASFLKVWVDAAPALAADNPEQITASFPAQYDSPPNTACQRPGKSPDPREPTETASLDRPSAPTGSTP